MKKTLVILNLVILSLFISGCGCSKKEETTELKCVSETNEYGEKNVVTAQFKENFLVYEKVETIVDLKDEVLAQRYYDMYKDNDSYKATLDGTTVTYYLETENDSTEDIFEYNKFRENLINDNYTCDVN